MSNIRRSQNMLKRFRVLYGTYVTGRQPAKKNTRERGDTPPPVDAMVAMASTSGESLPDWGEQWLYRKLCSPPVDGGYSGGVDETSPLKISHLLTHYLAAQPANITTGMADND